MSKTSARALLLMLCMALGCSDDEFGSDDEAAPAARLGAPRAPTGLYHLPGSADAVSLEIAYDHSFRWVIHGCDSGGQGGGRWDVVDGRVLLLPEAGELTFLWPSEERLVEQRALAVGAGSAGVLQVGDEASELQQGWDEGGACALCDGPLGPAGQTPCERPFD